MKIIDVEMQNRYISNVIFQFLSADFLNSSITSHLTIQFFYALLFFFGGGGYALHWFMYIHPLWFKFSRVTAADFCEWGCVNVNKSTSLHNVGPETCRTKKGFVRQPDGRPPGQQVTMLPFLHISGYNLVSIISSTLSTALGHLYGAPFVWKINSKSRCNKENVIFKIWSHVYAFK